MPRREIPGNQKLSAYAHYSNGVDVGAAIARLLEAEYHENAVNERTVRRWLPDFEKVQKSTAGIDEPFEWRRMGEYGIPWDQGRFIHSIALEALAWSTLFDGYPVLTGREALWCWRVRGALRLDVPKSDIHSVARALVARELRHEVLGEPFYTADIDAWFQYRPWELEQGSLPGPQVFLTPRGFEQFPQTGAYLVAISQGIIPALRVQHTNDELRATENAFRARGRDWIAAVVSAMWPSDLNGPRWRLPSQNIETILNDEERKEGEGDEQARKQ